MPEYSPEELRSLADAVDASTPTLDKAGYPACAEYFNAQAEVVAARDAGQRAAWDKTFRTD